MSLNEDVVVPRFEVECIQKTPKDFWEEREELEKAAKDSQGEWEKMSKENREAAVILTERALARMYEDVEDWLPESFEHVAGEVLTVRVFLVSTDIDGEVERQGSDLKLDKMAGLSAASDLVDVLSGGVSPEVIRSLDTLVEHGVLTPAERDERIAALHAEDE